MVVETNSSLIAMIVAVGVTTARRVMKNRLALATVASGLMMTRRATLTNFVRAPTTGTLVAICLLTRRATDAVTVTVAVRSLFTTPRELNVAVGVTVADLVTPVRLAVVGVAVVVACFVVLTRFVVVAVEVATP